VTPPPSTTSTAASGTSEPPPATEIAGFQWTGEISPQKWMNFYTKVLSRFATSGGLKLTVSVDVEPPGGADRDRGTGRNAPGGKARPVTAVLPASPIGHGTTVSKVEETKVALLEMGLSEDLGLKHW
jgi:hypothetical protein